MDIASWPVCRSEFWDPSVFWNTESPSVTSCFRHSVLEVIPCVWLWLTSAIAVCVKWRQRSEIGSPPFPWTILRLLKLLFSCALIILTSMELMSLLLDDHFADPVAHVSVMELVSPLLRILTLILALLQELSLRRCCKLSSSQLFIYWFLYALCSFWTFPGFELITRYEEKNWDDAHFIMYSLVFPIIIGQLVLSAFTDPPYDYLWDVKKDMDVIQHQTLLGRLTFDWMSRIAWYGYRHIIKVEDLSYYGSHENASEIFEKFNRNWMKEEEKIKKRDRSQSSETAASGCKGRSRGGKPSLCMAIVKTFWPMMLLATLMEFLFDLIIFLPPLILDLFIEFVDNEEPQWHGYVYSFLLFLTGAVSTLLMIHNLHFLVTASLVPRLGLSSAIYRKCLRLSSGARRMFTVGELCNLLSVDSQKVFELVWSVSQVWSCPLRIILTITMLWQYLGAACLSGIGVMVLIMPITGILVRRTHLLQEKQMTEKDKRLRNMNEILNGVKVLKLFAWEVPFMKQIGDIRKREVVLLRKLSFLKGGIVFLWVFAPFLIAISSFVTFLFMDERNVLDPSIAFVSLTLFNKLRFTVSVIPEVISQLVQSRVAFRRLGKFLLCEEIKEGVVGNKPTAGSAITIKEGNFSWTTMEDSFLKNINVEIAEGSLVAVVGQVGAGKSALLSAILGEMHKVSGSLDVQGQVAYVSQQAWIQNTTLRQNVLFMKYYEHIKYEAVIDKCCLKPDLKILPAGDRTEIGEKGVNLSGGQKQRVNLARAVYQNADIYILDDPLSAVDSHVGSHLFNHVIGKQGLLGHKTRILVTHDLSVLPEVDHILVLANGRIEEMGSYPQLMEKKGEFAKFVEEHLKKFRDEEDEDSANDRIINSLSNSSETKLSAEDLKLQMKRLGSRLSRSHSATEQQQQQLKVGQKKTAGKFIDDETMEIGRVKMDTILSYFRYGTCTLSALMLLGYIAYQTFEIGSNFWLSAWSSDDPVDGTQDIQLRNMRMIGYGILGLGQGVSILISALILAVLSTKASIRFHEGMMMSILRSPMTFFDTTPIGRILNRFGKDINTVDIDIPNCVNRFFDCLMAVVGTLVVNCVTNPLFAAILMPLSVLYICLQNFYVMTSRQIRRLQAITLSPVLSGFSETVQGAVTIRAFEAQDYFIERENKFLDDSARTFFNSAMLNRWLSIRLEIMGSFIVLIIAILAVTGRSTLEAGIVGLSLSYALNITEALGDLVKLFALMEIRMVSAERINEYSSLTPEAAWESNPNKKIPKEWPHQGSVSFRNYILRYRKDMDMVLRGVNIEISPNEKVGLVGRTGAGKSTLALALFRIVEPSDGSIVIDGQDIASIGLHDLRSRLTIIPQDPVLFSGSLRINLDPLSQHSDEDVWIALEHAHLKSFVTTLGSGLEYQVSEGGENLSVGQRQQLCLARALLKKSKILVLDEATAAVDMETDRLIQMTIRAEFKFSTVITIAHRLYTILDYDRIIVMDNGKVAEEGKPDDLLQDPSSLFYKLAQDAGLL